MRVSPSKGICTAFEGVRRAGWLWPGFLGATLRRTLSLAQILVRAVWLVARYLAGGSRQRGPVMLVLPGQLIPADGEVVEGTAIVDEAALTGSSSAFLREPVGECSAVLKGTRVLFGRILVRVRAIPRRANKRCGRPS
jgi:high-affinity K+ transport system ATPase subunit B